LDHRLRGVFRRAPGDVVANGYSTASTDYSDVVGQRQTAVNHHAQITGVRQLVKQCTTM